MSIRNPNTKCLAISCENKLVNVRLYKYQLDLCIQDILKKTNSTINCKQQIEAKWLDLPIIGPVAQRIRHLTTDQGIPGSNPGRIDVFIFSSHFLLHFVQNARVNIN